MTSRVVAPLLLILVAGVSSAQTLPPVPLERWLLPITAREAHGAFGTVWSTELWMRIDAGGEAVWVAPSFADSPCEDQCPIGGGPPDDAAFKIGFLRTRAGEHPGSLLYVEEVNADDVHASLRLIESSRGNVLQLPVVREREFTTRRVHILGIPIESRSRALLRIYGIDPAATGEVRVRVFREDQGPDFNRLLLDRTLPFTVMQRIYTAGPFSYPVRPPYAQLDLQTVQDGMVRVELSSLDPTLRLWGFVSITENDTQRVTLRVP
jgi:hypothetical protein